MENLVRVVVWTQKVPRYPGDISRKVKLGTNFNLQTSDDFPPGVRAGGGGGEGEGAAAPPATEIFGAKRWWFGQKYSGENTQRGSQSQTWRLLSPTIALSRRS